MVIRKTKIITLLDLLEKSDSVKLKDAAIRITEKLKGEGFSDVEIYAIATVIKAAGEPIIKAKALLETWKSIE